MKLSEAIRLGAMLSPQGYDGYADGETRCALAAACDAVGITAIPIVFPRPGLVTNCQKLRDRFPVLLVPATYPTFPNRTCFTERVIYFLNDTL